MLWQKGQKIMLSTQYLYIQYYVERSKDHVMLKQETFLLITFLIFN